MVSDETSNPRVLPTTTAIWLFLGGVFLAMILVAIDHFFSTSLIGANLFAGQRVLLLFIALIMFGYYLGIAWKERMAYALFLTGFLSGSLLLAVWLLAIYSTFDPYLLLGTIGSLGAGLVFGTNRPFLSRKELDSLIRWGISGGGWTIQIGSGISSLASNGNVLALIVVGIVIVALFLYYLKDRDRVRDMFSLDLEAKF